MFASSSADFTGILNELNIVLHLNSLSSTIMIDDKKCVLYVNIFFTIFYQLLIYIDLVLGHFAVLPIGYYKFPKIAKIPYKVTKIIKEKLNGLCSIVICR